MSAACQRADPTRDHADLAAQLDRLLTVACDAYNRLYPARPWVRPSITPEGVLGESKRGRHTATVRRVVILYLYRQYHWPRQEIAAALAIWPDIVNISIRRIRRDPERYRSLADAVGLELKRLSRPRRWWEAA